VDQGIARTIARNGFLTMFGREPAAAEVSALAEQVTREQIGPKEVAQRLFLSKEGLDVQIADALTNHLYHLHFARLIGVRTLLPQADVILDLGGANAPLHELGYPQPFKRLVIIDLPTDQRHQMYADIVVKPAMVGEGEVLTHFSDMTDLKAWDNASVELVWSGQSIEHVPIEAGKRMVQEAFRVLKPGRRLCLDTPNGLITRIHAATADQKLIHPEHFIEYEPEQLQSILREAGFVIEQVFGIRHMPRTARRGVFDYTDFVLGATISPDVNGSYVQFVEARKP
jgi:hypothetical protein